MQLDADADVHLDVDVAFGCGVEDVHLDADVHLDVGVHLVVELHVHMWMCRFCCRAMHQLHVQHRPHVGA